MFFALFYDWPGEFDNLRHFEADFLLDDFQEGDVRGAEIADIRYERPAQRTAARSQLADAPGNQVDQNVGIANFLHCFFRQFSVQSANSGCLKTS